jgi:membrane associated rhomboid family serine protease/ribosomal protein L40E
MASSPDLFVVCKKCGSEVSPYVTECPYCGTRLRKRAPKLERGGVPAEPKAPGRRRPTLGRLKPGEIPGIRADRRPYGTLLIVLASVLVTLGGKAGLWSTAPLLLTATDTDDAWRPFTTLFVYGSTGYEVVALGATFLFGWLLERRHGLWAPLLVFLLGGGAGMFSAVAADDVAVVAMGANGAALALLAAWTMRDVLGRRKGREDESDLLGALAIAAVLILLPLATAEASAVAGLGGGVVGVLLGLLLARLPER